MTLEQKVENIPGNLRDAYKQAVPGTVLHVDELMREQITNPDLRDLWFYTADGSVYSMDGTTPTLRITREHTNPVLNHIDDAFDQLVNRGNYQVLPADFEAVKAAKDTVTINLTQLGLQGKDSEWRYLAVNTSKAITEYNDEQQKLLRRVFGPTDEDYTANMNMLRESPQQIKETRVYVLSPEYVKEHTKESPIARACWLADFYDYSCFNARVRAVDIGSSLIDLRGVRKKSEQRISAPESDMLSDSVRRGAEGADLRGSAAAKNGSVNRTAAPIERNDYSAMVEALVTHPEEAIKALDLKKASAFSEMILRYLASQK